MLSFNNVYSPKGLKTFRHASYVFTTFIYAVISVVKSIKSKDHIIGRFLVIKFANAISYMFTFTITMLMTFAEKFN